MLLMDHLEELENAKLSITDVYRVMPHKAEQAAHEGSLLC